MEIDEFCRNLPKIELHAHLNGSLSAATLKSLGAFPEDITEFQKLTSLLTRNDKTLQECFSIFKISHNATSNPDHVYRATRDVIKEFRDDNVIYLELRTTPRDEVDMTKIDYIEAVIKGIRDESQGILVKLLLSINRSHDEQFAEESMDFIIEMKKKYPDVIVGVDLSGNPAVGRFNSAIFEKARDHGLKVALHCGEVKNAEEIRQILEFKPDRLGHGTCIHPKYGGTEEIWELYKKDPIPIECCITSNVICGTCVNYKEHHVGELITSSYPFTLGTDDKGVFCTTLSNEYQICGENFNLNYQKLWEISYKSIDYSFANQEEKQELQRILDEWKTKHLS